MKDTRHSQGAFVQLKKRAEHKTLSFGKIQPQTMITIQKVPLSLIARAVFIVQPTLIHGSTPARQPAPILGGWAERMSRHWTWWWPDLRIILLHMHLTIRSMKMTRRMICKEDLYHRAEFETILRKGLSNFRRRRISQLTRAKVELDHKALVFLWLISQLKKSPLLLPNWINRTPTYNQPPALPHWPWQ